MTGNSDQALDYKRIVDESEKKIQELEIRKGQILISLKAEFSCQDIEQARIMLENKKKELEESEKRYAAMSQRFEDKWGDKIDSLSG